MRKNSQKLSVEKTLGSMHLERIDAHNLENAKTRVWNKLSHSIDNFDNTNKMSQIEPIAQKGTFWNKYHKSFLSFGIVALVVASTVGTTTYLTLKDRRNTQTVQQPGTGKTADSTEDIRAAASKRFEALTGITYDEYKVVAANAKNTETNAQAADTQVLKNNSAATGRGSIAIAQVAPTLDPEKIKELSIKAESKDTKVFYTETEITINNPGKLGDQKYGIGLPGVPYGNNPAMDMSKPVIMKTWFGSNYSKEEMSQDGKVFAMHIYTPEFDLDFRGGKYAVRSNHLNNNNYFIGITGTEEQNPDLQFIKYILSENSNFKKVGTKVVDGKTLTIYEDTVTSEMMSSYAVETKMAPTDIKTKYYVDVDKLQVRLVEYYIGDTLVSTTVKKDSKEYTGDGVKIVADYSSLGTTEIKTINRDNVVSYEMPNQKIVDFIAKYPIYYVNNGERVSSVYDNAFFEEQQRNDPYGKLVNNKDFDPGYDASMYGPGAPFNQGPVGGYGQMTIYHNIYKEEPTRFKQQNAEEAKYRTVEKSDVTVNIAGKSIKGTKYKETFKFESDPSVMAGDNIKIAPMASSSYSVVFQYNGYWYEINESVGKAEITQGLGGNTVSLVEMTREEAQRTDKENIERQNAFVEMEFGVTLKEISKDIRLLPGDLSQTLKVEAMMVAKPREDQTGKACEKFEDTLNIQCVINKFGGFQMDLSTRFTEDMMRQPTPTQGNYYQYYVINAKLDQVKPLIDKINNGLFSAKFDVGGLTVTREINGKTVIVIADQEANKANANKILDGVKLDNGLEALSKQLENSMKPIQVMSVDMAEPSVIKQ
jgi:hypothetical protein